MPDNNVPQYVKSGFYPVFGRTAGIACIIAGYFAMAGPVLNVHILMAMIGGSGLSFWFSLIALILSINASLFYFHDVKSLYVIPVYTTILKIGPDYPYLNQENVSNAGILRMPAVFLNNNARLTCLFQEGPV